MFYPDDLLQRQRPGLATVWLVGTLGSKSSLRRVHRKDILRVSITNVCEVVINPPQPLALRLSSFLLRGVTSIYEQQFQSLVSDLSKACSRGAQFKASRANAVTATQEEVIATTGTRRRNLLLSDDPAFSIYFGLLPTLPPDIFSSDPWTTAANDPGPDEEHKEFLLHSVDLLSSDDPATTASTYLPTARRDTVDAAGDAMLLLSSSGLAGEKDDFGHVSFEFGEEGDIVDIPEPASGGESPTEYAETRAHDFNERYDDEADVPNDYYPPQDGDGDVVFTYDRAGHRLATPTYSSAPLLLSVAPPDAPPAKRRRITIQKVQIDETTQLSSTTLREQRDEYAASMAAQIVLSDARRRKRFLRHHVAGWFVYGVRPTAAGREAAQSRLGFYDILRREHELAQREARKRRSVPGDDAELGRREYNYDRDMDIGTDYYPPDDGGGMFDVFGRDDDGGSLDDIELARQNSLDDRYASGSSLLPWNLSGTGSSLHARQSAIFTATKRAGSVGASSPLPPRRRGSSMLPSGQERRGAWQFRNGVDEEGSEIGEFDDIDDAPMQDYVPNNEDELDDAEISQHERETRNFFEYFLPPPFS
ncbi:Rec8 like protein-domain-containing protein [Limtongia smithiae]|uniref:Rec8 like protein-domain-containing protein n=1 Tax=Limtongia smithiae TaxID=1125753 RepID=UPI0034CDA0B1